MTAQRVQELEPCRIFCRLRDLSFMQREPHQAQYPERVAVQLLREMADKAQVIGKMDPKQMHPDPADELKPQGAKLSG